MSSPRRSSPRRSQPDEDNLVGKRTGVNLPPKGSIPLNEQGYEDLDAFFDAAKSPHPNNAKQQSSATEAKTQNAQQRAEERQRKVDGLEEQKKAALQKKPVALSKRNDASTKKKFGMATPKNVSGWSNRLLHKAMGIPTDDSPGTVLSKVSTAPPSAKSVATLASVAQQRQRDAEGLDVRGKSPEEEGPVDPPEETEDQRGLDPDEDDAGFDNDHDTFSNNDGVDAQSSQVSAKSSGKTPPDMENSMEEMVDIYDDEYDGDKEGNGFELNTQEEVGFENNYDGFEEEEVQEQEQVASQKSEKDARSSDDEEEEQVVAKKPRGHKKPPATPTSVLRTKKTKKKKKNETKTVNWSTPNGTAGHPTSNREYEIHPISEYKEEDEEAEQMGLRRSKRPKMKPLKYWKSERVIFGPQHETGVLGEAMGDMPVVKDVQLALPTPHKVRPKPAGKKKVEGQKKRSRDDSDDETTGSHAKIPFDPKQLLKKYIYSNGEHGTVWSEALEDTAELKLVSRLDNRSFSKLPLSTTRGKRESKVVGFASQAFHVPTDQDDLFPGYISGNVVLPPRGIKDAEGVGLCSQVFNVGDCQPNSVEFSLADPASQDGEFDPVTAQRFLLSKGDMFQIPPGNVYRIENHSRTDEARLFWTIIKCTSRAEQESDDE